MDNQPPPGRDFADWCLTWLDLTGECEQARGRLIDDIKVTVLPKSVPKSNSGKQIPCDARTCSALVPRSKNLRSSKTANRIVAVSTAASDSESSVSALGWHGSLPEKGHDKGKNRENGKGNGRGEGKGKQGKEKGWRERQVQEQQRARKKWLVDLSPMASKTVDGTCSNGVHPVDDRSF